PVLPARDFIIFPQVVLPAQVSGEKDIRLINDAAIRDRLVVYVAVKNPEVEKPGPGDLYDIGCVTGILRMLKFPDDSVRLMIQGLSRARIVRYTQTEPYLVAEVERLESPPVNADLLEPLRRTLVTQFQKVVDLSPHLPDELKVAVMNIDDASRLCDLVASTINLSVSKRQEILEELDLQARTRKTLDFLNRELQVLELSSKIQDSVKTDMEKGQREFFLRRQLKAIQEELGETDAHNAEIKELRERVEKAGLPEEAKKEAERELERLERMPPQAAEYTVARTYLDWVLALPWNESSPDRLDVKKAEKTLEEDHYGLEKVKRRILEYVAVRKLKKDMRGPILCFVGPPGTGKTSLGKSIARAVGRKFVRISLGGVRDEAEIRGHRRTYVGALPGRIIQGLRKAGTNNPVFMLDEVDKLGADFRGDPSSALLEALDPEQNSSFSDHYLDVPFDLSKVMFITTANVLGSIPEPLRDRMEVLELPGYTEEEKLAIAKRFLVPRQMKANGLKKGDAEFGEGVLRLVISEYTREAGLRNLERELGSICRRLATEKARLGKRFKRRKVTPEAVAECLGAPRFARDVAEKTLEPGVTTGLAWTPAGGDVLFVEATSMAGRGALRLTGQLGDVMKESAQAAMSYVRAHAAELGLKMVRFDKIDVHIHVPAGAISKDGPSAGVTMAMALIGLLTKRPARGDVAMTGEITLRGRVLPVGGIKDKALAARRAGIREVILPAKNEKDVAEMPEDARKGMKFRYVEHVSEMLPLVFDGWKGAARQTAKKSGGGTTRSREDAKKDGRRQARAKTRRTAG
ncbi:MAG TPA: endopeptidase La, partial [Candidatus Brocadiia bacterium]|nr:endopeptidase La [Candidatus Brocadiia bacterium]